MTVKGIKVDTPLDVQARIAGVPSIDNTKQDASPTEYIMQLFVPASIKLDSTAVYYRSGVTAMDTEQDLSDYDNLLTHPFIYIGDKTMLHVGVEFSHSNGAATIVPVLYYANDATSILSTHRDISFSAGYYRRTAAGKFMSPAQEIMAGGALYARLFVKFMPSDMELDIVAGAR